MRRRDELGERRFAELPNGRLHYERAGAGRPVLLLHGWPETLREWDTLAPQLAREHDVIAVDLPGLGKSAPREGGYGKREVAGDLAALIVSLDLGPVAVVGHDMGAAVGFALAAFNPQVVTRLAALDMLLPGFGLEAMLDLSHGQGLWHFAFHQPEGVAEMLVAGRERAYLRWFFDNQAHRPGLIPDELIDAYAAAYASPQALRAGFGYYRAVLQDAADNEVFGRAKIVAPTLCISGSAGTGAYMMPSFEGACATVTGRIIQDCGHWIAHEQPGALLHVLEPFLRV